MWRERVIKRFESRAHCVSELASLMRKLTFYNNNKKGDKLFPFRLLFL